MALESHVRRRKDNEAEIPLSGVRTEFRTALGAEMEAASRPAATPPIPLVNGRKIGRLADAFQYVFGAEAAITVPGDSPGVLRIGGLPPLDASVTAAEGLDLTLSVSRDLGDRVARAVLRIDLVIPLRRLIARIEETRTQPNPAGDRLLGAVPASGAPELIDDPLLDDPQGAALASSLGRDVTFICASTGPAKTRTIGSIGAHLYDRGRSLMLVSHTNRAVDQAVIEVVERLGADLAPGALLRVGVPCDGRLREREDLLLEAVVRRREEELRTRQTQLRTEKLERQTRIGECERLLGIAAWAEGKADLADLLRRLDALETAERTHRRLAEELAGRGNEEPELRALVAEAQATARRATEAERLRAELPGLAGELDSARAAVTVADAAASEAERNYEKACELEPLVERERALPALSEQWQAVEALAVREAEAKQEAEAARESLREAEETRAAAAGANAIERCFRGFLLQIRLRRVVAARRARQANAQVRLDGLSGRLRRARAVLAELEQLDRQLSPWRRLGSPAIQEVELRRREAERELAMATETALQRRHAKLERRLAEAAEAVARFRNLHAAAPGGVLARVEPRLAELHRLRDRVRETEHRADELRKELDADLGDRLAAIQALGLGRGSCPDNVWDRFEEVALAQFEAKRLAAEIDAPGLEVEVTDCRREAGAIDEAIVRLDEEVETIRPTAIADAVVIATTLTRACLSNEFQDRRFDTVILDEASLAPIPALWTVARLADANVVVIGDLGQTPTKYAQHPLADKWLARNVFEVSTGRLDPDCADAPPHLVPLGKPSETG